MLNQRGVFGDRNELGRGDAAEEWIIPSCQRFKGNDRTAAQVELRLERDPGR